MTCSGVNRIELPEGVASATGVDADTAGVAPPAVAAGTTAATGEVDVAVGVGVTPTPIPSPSRPVINGSPVSTGIVPRAVRVATTARPARCATAE